MIRRRPKKRGRPVLLPGEVFRNVNLFPKVYCLRGILYNYLLTKGVDSRCSNATKMGVKKKASLRLRYYYRVVI